MMKNIRSYRAFRIAIAFLFGTLVMACNVKEVDEPDPTPTEETEKQLEQDRSNIIEIVSSCISDDFNAETLVKEKLDLIRAIPTVKSAEVTSAGLNILYVDGTEEAILFDYGTAFDDETTAANSVSYFPPRNSINTDTKVTTEYIHIFNLFSEDSGRNNQNQLMKSAAKELEFVCTSVIEHPFKDFTVEKLISALSDRQCSAIFISTIGDDSGRIAVGGEYYKDKKDGYSLINLDGNYTSDLYSKLTPAGKNNAGNAVNQLLGHSYRGVDINLIIRNIPDANLNGKLIYFSSCHTLASNFVRSGRVNSSINACIAGWDNVNMLGEAYALIMAHYMSKRRRPLSAFQAEFKNCPSGIEDKYTGSGARFRVKGGITDFTFYPGINAAYSKTERESLKPHKIQITTPGNGECVNPFAIYSVGIGGNSLVYFDYLLDSGETVSLWHNTTPQGRVYYVHTNDFSSKEYDIGPLGMWNQKKLNPYAVVSFYNPGVMRVEFCSQEESDYKQNGPNDFHKEDAIYLIAPRNYKKNDPVQNLEPSVVSISVLKVDNNMYAYGGILNMEGTDLTKGFKLSKKGDSEKVEVPATNDGNLFYAPMPNMKKGVEYTVIAYAKESNGKLYEGEPYNFVSEVDSANPSEPTSGDFIDMGLSVKWASCNLGATEPQEPGDYYAWGETQTKFTYTWSTYLLSNGSNNTINKYCTQAKYGNVDNKVTLESSDDAAYVNSQGKMRMPTTAEYQELVDKCQWSKIKYREKDGYLFVSSITGNSIFIPCNGLRMSYLANADSPYYWTADLGSEGSCWADAFLVPSIRDWDRCDGFGIRPVANTQVNDTPDTETITVNGVTFKMVKVEAGSFIMGSPDNDPDAGGIYSDEKPQHRVSLSSYAIGETEVTQALWKVVMGNNPSQYIGDNLPVEEISWDEAQSFVKKLSSMTGRSFRLPTEAEWEYAARGGKYSKGYRFSGSNDVHEVSWNCENSDWITHTVATKKPNELGLYDMSGNVWEWCQDWYDFNYYSYSPSENPCNMVASDYHIHRGASIEYIVSDHRVAMRGDYINPPSNRLRGLRLVLSSLSQTSTFGFVDLGLPSGTKWATCNVGATKPEEPGVYFAWGESYTKNIFSSSNYSSSVAQLNTSNIAGTSFDPAFVMLGSDWRMPTESQMQELHDYCTFDSDGEGGLRLVGPNGNSIFIPMSGYINESQYKYKGEYGFLWVSNRYKGSCWWWSNIHTDEEDPDYWPKEYMGVCVRPVFVGNPNLEYTNRSAQGKGNARVSIKKNGGGGSSSL